MPLAHLRHFHFVTPASSAGGDFVRRVRLNKLGVRVADARQNGHGLVRVRGAVSRAEERDGREVRVHAPQRHTGRAEQKIAGVKVGAFRHAVRESPARSPNLNNRVSISGHGRVVQPPRAPRRGTHELEVQVRPGAARAHRGERGKRDAVVAHGDVRDVRRRAARRDDDDGGRVDVRRRHYLHLRFGRDGGELHLFESYETSFAS
jgi:hypothetical protein